MKTIRDKDQVLRDVLTMTLAIVLYAVGIYFFKFPNHFSTGGVTGFAVVLAQLIPGISVTGLSNLMNISLLVLGLVFIGRDFGYKTIYCTLLLSGLLFLLEHFVPLSAPLTDEPFMELMISMIMSATGAALLFNVGASSGGTDVVAMLLRKYAHVYSIGTALIMVDFLAAIATFFVFDLKTGLFPLFGLVIMSALLQMVLSTLKQRKYFHIITEDAQAIKDFIIGKLGRSATLFEGKGAFTGEGRSLIVTVVSAREAALLKNHVKTCSPDAFLLITNTDEIIGKGFRNAL